MEILVFFLAILVFSSIILISMVTFRLAVATLLKINSIEKEIIKLKHTKK
jgi:hypothetical protein